MVRFGPSGNDEKFYAQGHKSSKDVFEWLKQIGLDLYEYSFGRGILLKDETALEFANLAKLNNIEISVHAPYFINLANPNEEQIKKSFDYITASLKKLKLMNGNMCVVHLGSCMKMNREEALQITKKNLIRYMEIYDSIFKDDKLFICPETMGKFQQIGTYKEITDLCTIHDALIPTFDFGHINCILQGKLDKNYYRKILDYLFDKLGDEKANKLHIHFSKIEFSDRGEVKHLTLDDIKYGPEFEPLAELLIEYKMDNVTVISESKNIMAQDALKLKKIYQSLVK